LRGSYGEPLAASRALSKMGRSVGIQARSTRWDRSPGLRVAGRRAAGGEAPEDDEAGERLDEGVGAEADERDRP
jgi:hypothetical protein